MNCSDGFITMRTVCAGQPVRQPKSGLFIEDLAGINCANLASVEPGVYLNAQEFLAQKVAVSCDIVLQDLREIVEPFVKERSALEAGTVGEFASPASPLTGSASQRGLRLRINAGRLSRLLVDRIWIRSASAVETVVKVKDGDKVTEFPVSLEAGKENELWLHYQADQKQVDIVIEDAAYQPHSGTTIATKYFSTCTTCHGGGAMYTYLSGSALLAGAETDTLQGIVAECSLVCDIELAACMMLKKVKWPVLIQTGIQILQELVASGRMNYWTIHSKDWAKEQIEFWHRVEYKRMFKHHAAGMAAFLSNLDPHCLTCGTGTVYTYAHP